MSIELSSEEVEPNQGQYCQLKVGGGGARTNLGNIEGERSESSTTGCATNLRV